MYEISQELKYEKIQFSKNNKNLYKHSLWI